MPAPLIAVTGATGAVGRRVVARLAGAAAPPRLIVRDARRAPRHAGAEVRQAADYGDGPAMRAALEGAGTLFLIPAAEAADRVGQHRTAVDAAVAAGVERIVYLSFLRAAADATFTFARDHWHTEQRIRATGLPWTFLRMSLYLDFIPSLAGPDGVIRGPAGDGRVAPVLRDDVAAAAAAVLLADGHDGRTYDLTGRERHTLGESAAIMRRVTGKPVRFVDETDAEALASRHGSGVPDFELRGWVSSYQAIRDGSLDVVTDDVHALTGSAPRSLEEHLREHPEALEHVSGGGTDE